MNKRIIFYDPYHLDYAGAQKSMAMLINGLIKKEENIILLTTKNSRLNQNVDKNVERIYIPNFVTKFYNKRGIKITLESSIIFTIFIYKLILERKQMVFIGNEELGVITLLPLRILFQKVIWYIRSSDNLGFINKLLYKFSNHIMTMDISLLKNKINSFEFSKVTSLGSIFIETRNSVVKKDIVDKIKDKKIIANIGAIVPRKNIIESIKAFEQLSHSDYYLLIIGPKIDIYADYYQEIKNKSYKNKKIIFIENYSNVEWLYKYIDILILTSKDEGIPRVILEALFYNKKVVSSDVGAIQNIFKNYISTNQVVTYSVCNIKKLVDCLNFQIQNKTSYSSKQSIEIDFGLDKQIKKFLYRVDNV